MIARKYTKEEILKAIQESGGIVMQVAHNLGGCDWHTARKYIGRWEETRHAFQGEGERALDFSETQMLKQIKEGDGPMIRFHLTTKGKNRGFTERHEYSDISEAELDRTIARELARLAKAGEGKTLIETPGNGFED